MNIKAIPERPLLLSKRAKEKHRLNILNSELNKIKNNKIISLDNYRKIKNDLR